MRSDPLVTLDAAGAPSPAASAVTGATIGERYVLSRRIAGGGMGDVWRAHDRVRERPVALKLLRVEYLNEPAFVARFRAEARLAGMLDHPGIAAVYDYGEYGGPGGTAWIVMEYVEGEPLSRLLARRGALPPEQALDVVGQAACALQAAHDAGVIHRDVKPGNLLVRPDGVVKITDFGIARAVGSVPLTRTGTVLGTAHYLSPEQARGRTASPASDVYALGVVAYECLVGRRPFEADSPVEVALAHQRGPIPPLPSGLPGPVVSLVVRALAKDPAERPSSAGGLGRTALGIRAALYLTEDAPAEREAAGGLAAAVAVPEAVRTDPAGGRSRSRRRIRWPQGVLAALLLAVTVGAVVRASTGRGGGTPDPGTVLPATNVTARLAVNPATYRGQPIAAAMTELSDLGLLPRRVDVPGQGAAGTVVTVVGADGGPLPATLARGAQVRVETVKGKD